MMYGYATYLEIGYDGRYKVFMHNEETNNWEKYDLISSYCKDS